MPRKYEFNEDGKHKGMLVTKWEGPYKVIGVLRLGTYKITTLGDKPLTHLWNVEHLKIYYL